MEHLPSELITEIYSHLPSEDITNLPFHITSRAFLSEKHRRHFSELYASLDKKVLQQIVRVSANPSLATLVTRISFSSKRPVFRESEWFLKRAWEEHVNYYDADSISQARPGRSKTKNPRMKKNRATPEDLTFENFHELVEVAESECPYCHHQSLESQYVCVKAEYLEWKSWHSRGQDTSMLTLAFSQLPNPLELYLDDHGDEYITWLKQEDTDRASDIPFFIHPHYNQCVISWSDSELCETVIQAIWPLQRMDGDFLQNSRDIPSTPRVRRCYCLLLSNLMVFIKKTHAREFAVNQDIQRSELAMTQNSYTGPPVFGTLSVCSIGDCVPEFGTARLHVFLNNIQILHGLNLIGTDDWSDIPFYDSGRMHILLTSCKSYNYLSKLNLSGYWLLQSTIVECLKTAAPTLQSLRLSQIALAEGTWPFVFDQLEGQFCLYTLSLELWDFTHTLVEFSEKDVQDVMDWMCGKSDYHSLRMMDANWMDHKYVI